MQLPQDELPPAVAEWLSAMPGGSYVQPHWNAGPWHLVPVSRYGSVEWQASVILDSYPPIGSFGDWDYLLVSDLGYRLLIWHQTERNEYSIEVDLVVDIPSAGLPTAQDVVVGLTQLLSGEGPDETSIAAANALRAADPVHAMEVISSLADGDGKTNEELLQAAAGIAASDG